LHKRSGTRPLFDVEYVSKQSYYDLRHEAGLSYKKAQQSNPKKAPQAVELKKKELIELGKQWAAEVKKGETIVLLEDKCPLHHRDAQGYVWGPSEQRVVVEMKNESERQTYYGALDSMQGNVVLKEFKKGETKATTAFIDHLLKIYRGKKIKLIWDGAIYHTSAEFRTYLEEINKGLERKDWRVECICLAPYAPEEKPPRVCVVSREKLTARVLALMQVI